MIDWTEASLVDTADAIQAGRLKARDLAEATLEKTERLAANLSCYVSVDPRSLSRRSRRGRRRACRGTAARRPARDPVRAQGYVLPQEPYFRLWLSSSS